MLPNLWKLLQYLVGKMLPERGTALGKSVIECYDKGSDCAAKIKVTS